jgi:sulfate adenylyltransferase subunit 1
MDIVRISTAGSVDDGKSTLIGRLLYETQTVPKDRLEAIQAASKRRGVDFLDLSLLTDGLIAEREQGITIDVAHVYFHTPRRKYIIADTPGHFEYTRNMVTGASHSAVSIILIDARNGIVEQTARHFYIATLLRIPHVIVCINKMDLVGYSQVRFDQIKQDFEKLAAHNQHNSATRIEFIPMSALHGESVAQRAIHMPWYVGPTLLQVLETVDVADVRATLPARLHVQNVIRPRNIDLHDYRGYAGRIASGSFRVGDEVVVLPGERSTHIVSIEKFGRQLACGTAGESIVVHLADEIDVSRGHLIANVHTQPQPSRELNAHLCWLDHTPLSTGKPFVLQHGTNTLRAKVQSLHATVNVNDLSLVENPPQLRLNEIGTATVRLSQPIYADAYAANPANGAFILIDEWSNNTSGVGFIA